MSESPASRRVLHLFVEGFPAERLRELDQTAPDINTITEIAQLTEASAPDVLEKIFAADTVAVWTKVE